MQFEDNLWLMERFYIDRNEGGELRIVGPRNHLYFGAVGLSYHQLKVRNITEASDEVSIELEATLIDHFWPDPAMGHIRQVRELTQISGQPERTFAQVNAEVTAELIPNRISHERTENAARVSYLRAYGDEFYGVRMTFSPGVELYRDDHRRGYLLEGPSDIFQISLTTISDSLPRVHREAVLRHEPVVLDPLTQALYDRTAYEIEHLVRNGKTSGFDYGTVFPRDYMETADLLSEDLTPEGMASMYHLALQHVDPSGAGWHEEIIGEFAYERRREIEHLSRGFDDFVPPDHPLSPQFRRVLTQLDELFVTRMMIDIEPHYLLGLRTLKFASLSTSDQKRLRSVAEFIVRRAQEASLITFNRVATPFRRQRADEYYEAGNWRDSRLAYLQVSPVIAPYDVNAVLYPQALRVIRDHASELGIDWRTVDQLITRWDKVEDWYRFTNPDGTSAKALALYDVTERFGLDPTFTQLRVNHTDEAYDLFYGKPTEKDVISFCKRLLSPQYFYTASGPLIVARGNGYTPAGYHGEVIWTKQTAYIVTGLKRQLAAEFSSDWATSTIHLMKQTLAAIATTSVAAFEQLKAIPELHIDVSGQPTWYTDQSLPEGQMNKVQLWSAAGARPIIRAAQEFKKLP